MSALDAGVFLVAFCAWPLLYWLAAAIRGRTASVTMALLLFAGAFGAGLAMVNHATGWVQ